MFPLQSADGLHNFNNGTTFELILDHYFFDSKLRQLLSQVIEQIEVSIKAQITKHFSSAYGPHWYTDSTYFQDKTFHTELLEKVADNCNASSERFIKHYLARYDDPSLPPSWMVMEVLSFGTVVKIYNRLVDNNAKKAIADSYNLVPSLLDSWLKSLHYVRNCCAHPTRLWNKPLTIKPTLPKRAKFEVLANCSEYERARIFPVLSCILYLLREINPESRFKEKLYSLIEEYPQINLIEMGFSANWKNEKIWVK